MCGWAGVLLFVIVAAGSDTVNGDTKATQPPVQLSLHVDGSAQPTDVVARTVVEAATKVCKAQPTSCDSVLAVANRIERAAIQAGGSGVLGVQAAERSTLAKLTIDAPAEGSRVTALDVILGVEWGEAAEAAHGNATSDVEGCLFLGEDLQPLGCFRDRHIQVNNLRPGPYIITAFMRRARSGRGGPTGGVFVPQVGAYDASGKLSLHGVPGADAAAGEEPHYAMSKLASRRCVIVAQTQANTVTDEHHPALDVISNVQNAFAAAQDSPPKSNLLQWREHEQKGNMQHDTGKRNTQRMFSRIGEHGELLPRDMWHNNRTGVKRFDPLQVQGMSGVHFRHFLNALLNVTGARLVGRGARYLEVGCYKGSTASAALFGNSGANAVLVDNWSMFGGPRQEFERNVRAASGTHAGTAAFGGAPATYHIIESDVWASSFVHDTLPQLGVFDVYFFDGPHGYDDQYRAITKFRSNMHSLSMNGGGGTVVLVDDWNYAAVRNATLHGVRDAGLITLFKREVRTGHRPIRDWINGTSSHMWHNGVGILVLARP